MIAAWKATEQSKQVCALSSRRFVFLQPDWLAANPGIRWHAPFSAANPGKTGFTVLIQGKEGAREAGAIIGPHFVRPSPNR